MRTRHVLLLAVLFALTSSPMWAAAGTLIVTSDTTLAGNLQDNIIIVADNVRLDCANFLVSGNGTGNGIEVVGRLDVTVENCHVTNFRDGFHIVNTQRSLFRKNRAFLNTDEGFSIENSDGNLFIENIAGGGTATGTVRNRCAGIVRETEALGNGGDGFDLDNSHENFFFKNTVTLNGFPVCTHVEGAEANCNGIEMDFSDNNVFVQNTASDNQNHGFSIDASDANTFSQNTANNNCDTGFEIESFSSRNTFFDNNAAGNLDKDAVVQVDDPGPPPVDGFCNIFVANHFGTTEGLELACINLPD
jgi:parallel beta-helix repeat protein